MGIQRSLVVFLTLLLTSGCVESRLASLNLQQSMSDGSDQIAEFSNRQILQNVIRAEYYAPLNYSDLTSISVNTSAQTTAAFTIPFGTLHGSTNRNSAGPGEVLATSPTASISSLNSQGFVVAMMQPTNPLYIASKWNAGYDDEMLLLMFVKSIQFSNGETLKNNPDDEAEFSAFSRTIHALVPSLSMRTVTIMEPLGSPLHFSLTKTTKGYLDKDEKPTTSAQSTSEVDITNDATAVATLAQSFSDGQLHLGNVDCAGNFCQGGQLYREYTQQVVLCSTSEAIPGLDKDNKAFSYEIYDPRAKAKLAALKIQKQTLAAKEAQKPPPQDSSLLSLQAAVANLESEVGNVGAEAAFMAKGHAAQPPASPSGSGPATSGSSTSATATGGTPSAGTTAITTALSSNRVGAVIYEEKCNKDELVRKPQTETDYEIASSSFTHVEWRSPSELIDFLGALARHSSRSTDSKSDDTQAYFFAVSPVFEEDPFAHIFSAMYNDQLYAVRNIKSLQAMRILKELFDASKVSSGTSIPQPIIFVP